MRKRRALHNSVEEAVRVVSAGPIVAPATVPLDATDLRFFESIVDELARADWTAHQLDLAAFLARMLADLEREQRLLRHEGAIVESTRGTPMVNPRQTVLGMQASSILAFRRSMALHARGKEGEPPDIAAGRRARKALQEEVDAAAQDERSDLLSRPH